MKKRSFVLGVCAAVVAPRAMAGLAPAAAVAGAGQPAMALALPSLLSDAPDAAAWQHYLQHTFTIHGADGMRCNAVLDQWADVSPMDRSSEQFVLGFSSAQPMPSGLYRLEHGSGQVVDVYLNESGLPSRARLRAEFNLLTSASRRA